MSWTWQPTDEYDPIKAGSIDATDTRPHDRGIIRATQAYYDPTYDPNVTGDPKTTVVFARVAFDTSDETIRALFAKYGAIKRMRLVRHIVTGASRGYGFVEYERESDARAAYTNAHRAIVDGRQIVVDFERERTMEGWVPRRLGGGLGGRKESGQLRFGGHDRPFRRPILSSTPEAQWALAMMSRSRAPLYSGGGGSGERGERHRDSYAKEERRPEARDEGRHREREERGHHDSRREYSRDTDRDRHRDRGRRHTEERSRDRSPDGRDRDRHADGRDRDRHGHHDERSDADSQRRVRSEHRQHSSSSHGHSRESSHRD